MGPASASSCSVCGEPLGAKRVCFACLLRAGLDDAEQPVPPEPAALFDDFEIARREDGSLWELGRGAMGVTYRATEKTLHRNVALKVIELHGSETVRERFLREARAAAALRHPNVAGVFRFGALAETDRCYCAMELVEGETLDALVRRDGPLKLELALEIAIQITRALIAATERNLVHRDLKPGNIMLTTNENAPAKIEVKVIDFGLAKAAGNVAGEMELTHGEFVGTPAFASPEQFSGGAIDARTDIYALGVTLWFALSGRLPFVGRTIEEIRRRQSEEKLPLEQLTGVPRCVIDLLRSCLATDPSERPTSARVLIKELESCKTESVTRRRKGKLAVLAGIALVALGIATFMFWRNREHNPAAATVVPEKSIAVLPFENLSNDKENSYFADGIQDEILTRLSKIGELKVISRTSTQNYKSAPRNLPEIARQLGVSTILEGTVQKTGDKVRVNVQLIKAASDTHLWAETFDRKLTDIFSVESEVAKAIADHLQAKLTGEEEQVSASNPTSNPEAYDAYLRGLAYSLKTANNTANLSNAQKYLREAVRLDPKFALAWALLSYVEAVGYRTEFLQPTVALREESRQAAETALLLQPNLGEAVLAKGFYHYACLRDYDTAVRYFEEARPLLPNSSRIPESLAYVTRKQGEWDRSESYFNEAERLDPRNVALLTQHALSYKDRRMFPEASRKLEQILNITPDDADTIVEKAVIAQAVGDLSRASALLAPLHLQADNPNALETQVYQAILERRSAPMVPVLQGMLAKPDPALGFTNGELRFWLGWTQDISGDHSGSRETWQKARQELESFLNEHPEDYILLGNLALTDAALGDKAAALALADKAIAAMPIDKDAVSGPKPIEFLARVAAQLGERDRAIPALQKLMAIPYSGALGPGAPLTPALLRLDPMFDSLRNDPQFEKIVADGEQALARDLAARAPPAKSIAVLPFANLSRDSDNLYFAEGIQNEIMTRLSKIADLKVISRTSTQHYKSSPENLPEIARQLGVANILEGSVQKSGDTVRVNVQLIKADSDSPVWSETFDRKLTDIFSVQSDVAKAIADQLRAKLTGQEEQVLTAKPTENPQAYDAYLRGLAYSLKAANTTANILTAQKHLREAVQLDPKFALAWALLSSVDSSGYLTKIVEPTVALREEALKAADTALSLNPNLGEAVLAKGRYYYGCLKDYDAAIRYFEQARQLLPNDSRISESLAYVTRRRGQWEKSETYFNDAERLDVRNANLFTQHALSYMRLRRFPEALRKLDQVLNITPDDVHIVAYKASIAQAQGDLGQAAKLLAPLHPTADDPGALETQVYQAILERRPATLITRLQEILAKPDPELGYLNGDLRFWLGWAQEVAGDRTAAENSWKQARTDLEAYLKEQPQNANILSDLALTNMGLGDKAAALEFAERAIAANPLEKDAVSGPSPIETLARVTARMGERDRAIAALQKLLSIPAVTDTVAPITSALLRLDPMFDPLRNDPRFEKILVEAEKAARGESGATTKPAKSIAVLPFENRSSDPDNAFFTDGVQDEILTDLARIADLKVISRTSVMQYKNVGQRNMRQIANELGVANVLEGSVQRSGNRVRVNAQLIDALIDAHVWAQTYDRDLADVFAIQSEIAKAIADQLQAKLSPNEKSEIEQPPTTDVIAFDFYSHAKNLLLNASGSSTGKPDLLQAADLLNRAVARDPSFFEAYCQLAFAQASLYFFDFDRTPSRLAAAEAAVQTAARLRPDAGEMHLARARNLYWGHSDYDGALAELEIARQRLPSDNWVFSLKGYIERRQGRWEESLRDLERAIALDPRNILTLQQTARSYTLLHRYTESKSLLARVLSFEPNDPVTKVLHAFVELDSNANARPVLEVIDAIRRTNPAALPNVSNNWLLCALAERDIAAAKHALAACGENPILLSSNENLIFPHSFAEGMIARTNHEDDKARAAFVTARAEQEKIVQAHPNYGPALCVLGLIDAGLGRKEQALREGRRAVELVRAEKDALVLPTTTKYLAIIAAWVGDTDLACNQLDTLIRDPGGVSYGQLKLMPFWDPLRGDPRFEKIVASLAPK